MWLKNSGVANPPPRVERFGTNYGLGYAKRRAEQSRIDATDNERGAKDDSFAPRLDQRSLEVELGSKLDIAWVAIRAGNLAKVAIGQCDIGTGEVGVV